MQLYHLGFIGAGAMAEALINGVLKAGVFSPDDLIASDINEERLRHIREKFAIHTTVSNEEVMNSSQAVILAVKPQVLPDVLTPLAAKARPDQLIISIAAGITLEHLESILPDEVAVVRVMPNTPCLIGEGAVALALGRKVKPQQRQLAEKIFEAVGIAYVLPEEMMDAVTGLSGSGPAYIYLIIEALSDAGVRVGLPRDIATALAAQTVIGAARMVLDTGRHPGELKDMVTSPGGTTIAGLHALEEGGVRGSIMNAVMAAYNRSRELGSRKEREK
ncbi:pyrroline-5-carboxylate reductase [Calderihabitans maritimus]|uniref:pyrroline-5-carboxylate reductase n=1 Tax=Calderihabitans maritimus TaxID=1246530 RepID=UPI001EE01B68|nr:pyrroline-5-carboxylate reductase [Calderihabitans maritimus]